MALDCVLISIVHFEQALLRLLLGIPINRVATLLLGGWMVMLLFVRGRRLWVVSRWWWLMFRFVFDMLWGRRRCRRRVPIISHARLSRDVLLDCFRGWWCLT